jgi:hypothetical protein
MVTVAIQQPDEYVSVNPRMSHSLNVLAAVTYSKPMSQQEAQQQQTSTEAQAIDVRNVLYFKLAVFKIYLFKLCIHQALKQAGSMTAQALKQKHFDVWEVLWTTGFGISHSYADNAVNGAQVPSHSKKSFCF